MITEGRGTKASVPSKPRSIVPRAPKAPNLPSVTRPSVSGNQPPVGRRIRRTRRTQTSTPPSYSALHQYLSADNGAGYSAMRTSAPGAKPYAAGAPSPMDVWADFGDGSETGEERWKRLTGSNYKRAPLQGFDVDSPSSSSSSGSVTPPAITESEVESLLKKVQRRISRRGGYGLYGARSPLEGFDFEADRNSFGVGADPIGGGSRNHTGEDLGASGGTPILATVGGVVRPGQSGSAYGNHLVVDHGNGEQSMYAHMSQTAVAPGTKVKKGDVIGYVGSTGRSTGNHLHWETWKNGFPMDPNTVFNRPMEDDVVLSALQKYLKNHPDQGDVVQEAMQTLGGTQKGQAATAAQPSGDPEFSAFVKALREQESNHNYSATGVVIPSTGDRALGAYQIMGDNIEGPGGWDLEALGQEITGQQFLASPRLQNQIAKFKLRDYFKKGGAAGAAKAWYAGPDDMFSNSDSPQYGGPSVNDYADQVLSRMQQYLK